MKKINLILAPLIFLLFSASCSLNNTEEQGLPIDISFGKSKPVRVYFTKSRSPDDIYFVTVVRRIAPDENYYSAALRELFLGPNKAEEFKGIMTEIPIGTRLIDVTENPEEDEVLVNLSSQYLTGGGSATMQLRYLQLYKTLAKIAPDKKFYLLIEGKKIKAIGGEGLEVSEPLKKINDYTKKYEDTDDVQP